MRLVWLRWTAGVFVALLERCTLAEVFRLLVLAVTDLELLFLEEDVVLSAVAFRPFADELRALAYELCLLAEACDLVLAVRA